MKSEESMFYNTLLSTLYTAEADASRMSATVMFPESFAFALALAPSEM